MTRRITIAAGTQYEATTETWRPVIDMMGSQWNTDSAESLWEGVSCATEDIAQEVAEDKFDEIEDYIVDAIREAVEG